jgi:broad specificity phosphatase PhoE
MKTLLIALLTIASFNIGQAQSPEDITTIILVRHAEKMDDGTNDPDLSADGKTRALKLKSIFMKSAIDAIYSTPYKRTMQTASPIAAALALSIEEYNPSNKDFIDIIYQANKGKTVLVSGHSNTTPMAVNTLLKMDKYEHIGHEEYGRIFIVTISGAGKSSVLEIQY